MAGNIVYISMQTMQRFSAKDAMFPFCEEILFVNQGEMLLAFVCIQEVVCVCVCCWKALFFVKHQGVAIKVT